MQHTHALIHSFTCLLSLEMSGPLTTHSLARRVTFAHNLMNPRPPAAAAHGAVEPSGLRYRLHSFLPALAAANDALAARVAADGQRAVDIEVVGDGPYIRMVRAEVCVFWRCVTSMLAAP
jgi:hypothetical protein